LASSVGEWLSAPLQYGDWNSRQVRKQLAKNIERVNERETKKTRQTGEWVCYFYSPILNSTRIWRVSEWLSAALQYGDWNTSQVRKQLAKNIERVNERETKKNKNSPGFAFYFYSPILNFTRIWRVGEWLSAVWRLEHSA
jgi:uncharacterized protein YjaZ